MENKNLYEKWRIREFYSPLGYRITRIVFVNERVIRYLTTFRMKSLLIMHEEKARMGKPRLRAYARL